MNNNDDRFYDRADEHIQLCNQQLNSGSKGEVSAALMYSAARFNAWLSFTGWHNAKEMEDAKAETLDYFVEEYKKKLNENLEDYIRNFDQYRK